MSHPIQLTTATFETEVLKSDLPVLVDLWAPWCGPCRLIAPLIDEIAAETSERFKITKLDIDAHPELASQFGVRSIPTLLFFKNGAVADQLVGAAPKKTILAKLEALSASGTAAGSPSPL